jgi:hypothetical protein
VLLPKIVGPDLGHVPRPSDDLLEVAERGNAINKKMGPPADGLTHLILSPYHRGMEDQAMPDDRNGGRPPLDEVLDVLRDIYLTLRHSSRSKRTLRQARMLRRAFVMLEDC